MDNPTQNNFKKMQKNSTVYCFIPGCRSNTQRFPRKLFVNVPTDPNIREQWMIAAKRTFYSSKTVFRCCEDHFDVSIGCVLRFHSLSYK